MAAICSFVAAWWFWLLTVWMLKEGNATSGSKSFFRYLVGFFVCSTMVIVYACLGVFALVRAIGGAS